MTDWAYYYTPGKPSQAQNLAPEPEEGILIPDSLDEDEGEDGSEGNEGIPLELQLGTYEEAARRRVSWDIQRAFWGFNDEEEMERLRGERHLPVPVTYVDFSTLPLPRDLTCTPVKKECIHHEDNAFDLYVGLKMLKSRHD